MSTLTFILVLAVSLSVYAKTEATLNVKGFSNAQKQQRSVAESNVNDMNVIMAQLDKMNNQPSARVYHSEETGFGGKSGALIKPKSKKAAAKKKTAATQ